MKLLGLPLSTTIVLVIGRYASTLTAFESVASDLVRGHDPYWELLYECTTYRSTQLDSDDDDGEERKSTLEREAYTAQGRQWGYIRDLNAQYGRTDKIPCVNVDVNMRTTLIKAFRTEQDIFRLPYITIDEPQIVGAYFFEEPDCEGDPIMMKDRESRGYSYVDKVQTNEAEKITKGELAVLSTWDLTVNENPPVFTWYGSPGRVTGHREVIPDGEQKMDWVSGSSQPSSDPNEHSPQSPNPFVRKTKDSKLLKNSPFLSSEASSPQLPFPLPFQSFSPIYAVNNNIGYRYTDPLIPYYRYPRLWTPTEVVAVFKTRSRSEFNPLEIPFDRRSHPLEPLTSTGNTNKCFFNPAFNEGIVELGLLQYKFFVQPNPTAAKYQPVGIIFYNHWSCGSTLRNSETDEIDPSQSIIYHVSRADSTFDEFLYERRWKFAEPIKAMSFQLVLAQTSIGDSGRGSITKNGITFDW